MRRETTWPFPIPLPTLRRSAAWLALVALGGCVDASAPATHCTRNHDCDDSPEARRMENIRCPSEAYCLNGECRAHCSDQCVVLRADVNPCVNGSICQTLFGLCRFRPLV